MKPRQGGPASKGVIVVFTSPTEALGSHVTGVRQLAIEVVRSRHVRFAEAHEVSESRYSMGFGSQWRDLLVDFEEATSDHGYQHQKLPPAAYKVPVVNGCLVYLWRLPGVPDAVSGFASSPTRKSGFHATAPDPMLFEPGPAGAADDLADQTEPDELEEVVRAVGDEMQLLLIMVTSTPRQLQMIEWASAELDSETGKVKLHGRETIWEPDAVADGVKTAVESFDSGVPQRPAVEPREQQGPQQDA